MTGSIPPGANRTSTANCASPVELLPPRELQDWVGLGGPAVYKATGNEFVGYLVDLCGLQPGDAVLDVGCGSGRMALPLTGYLNSKGRYAGFDVAPDAVAWCTKNISGAFPNFDFTVADVQSKRYNPTGKYKPSEFHFPYPDGAFDVVLLASVFTHMLPADVTHYMHEIVRVLKPGGRSLITFFLLNEESSALSKQGKGHITFEHEIQGARTVNVENPEAAIAYPEAFVRDLYKECGLELQEPLRYGNWCGRPDGMSGQDLVIAVKTANRNRLAQGIDLEQPKGSANHPPIPLSDENIAVAEAMGVNPATTSASEASQSMPRMSPAAAEEYIASLYATVLRRDPQPDEFAGWVAAAANMPPEQVYFAFVNSKEYKLQQKKSAPATFRSGHHYSPNVDPSQIFENIPDLSRFGRSISFGKSGHSKEVIGPGWSFQEDAYRWMTGRFSVLTLPMSTQSNAADFILMLRVTPYTANGQIDCQRCTVVCGAETVAEVKLVLSVPTWIGFRVPAEAVVSEKLTILFVHPDAGSPQKFGIAPDSRELAIAVHEAVLLPVTENDELTGWRAKTGRFVSSDWRAQALVPDWKSIASKFQSMGWDCEFGFVQRQCEAEPLGLFRFSCTWLHALVQCLRSEFSELADGEKLSIFPSSWGEYVCEFKSLDLWYHTHIPVDQNLDIDALRRKELARLKMMVRFFREDLEDGEKVFVLLRKVAPLDEFEVLPVISLMRRYNPKAALLWITVAGPDERHLLGQCEIVGNNLLKGYIDAFSGYEDYWSSISLGCWKDILISALQALGKPIPTHAQGLPPEQKRLEMS